MCGPTAPSRGAIAHDAGQFDKHLYHFKFDFLQKQAARLNCDYFVWLGADNYFVCHPGDVLRVLSRHGQAFGVHSGRIGGHELTDCFADTDGFGDS